MKQTHNQAYGRLIAALYHYRRIYGEGERVLSLQEFASLYPMDGLDKRHKEIANECFVFCKDGNVRPRNFEVIKKYLDIHNENVKNNWKALGVVA